MLLGHQNSHWALIFIIWLWDWDFGLQDLDIGFEISACDDLIYLIYLFIDKRASIVWSRWAFDPTLVFKSCVKIWIFSYLHVSKRPICFEIRASLMGSNSGFLPSGALLRWDFGHHWDGDLHGWDRLGMGNLLHSVSALDDHRRRPYSGTGHGVGTEEPSCNLGDFLHGIEWFLHCCLVIVQKFRFKHQFELWEGFKGVCHLLHLGLVLSALFIT